MSCKLIFGVFKQSIYITSSTDYLVTILKQRPTTIILVFLIPRLGRDHIGLVKCAFVEGDL